MRFSPSMYSCSWNIIMSQYGVIIVMQFKTVWMMCMEKKNHPKVSTGGGEKPKDYPKPPNCHVLIVSKAQTHSEAATPPRHLIFLVVLVSWSTGTGNSWAVGSRREEGEMDQTSLLGSWTHRCRDTRPSSRWWKTPGNDLLEIHQPPQWIQCGSGSLISARCLQMNPRRSFGSSR